MYDNLNAFYAEKYKNYVNPNEVILLVGPGSDPECSVNVSLPNWNEMNRLDGWRWSTECVSDKQNQ